MNLNLFKFQQKTFILEVGDQFHKYDNGSIYYIPKGGKNRSMLPGDFVWHHNRTSMKLPAKYEKVFAKAENLVPIKPPQGYREDQKFFRVDHVDPVTIEKSNQQIIYIGIIHPHHIGKRDLFTIKTGNVKKETEKQFLMEPDFLYRSKILKAEFNSVSGHRAYRSSLVEMSDVYGVICRFDDIDKYRDELYLKLKTSLISQAESANRNLDLFARAAGEQGY